MEFPYGAEVELYEPPAVGLDDGAAEPYVIEGATEEYGSGTPLRLTWPKRGTASAPDRSETAEVKTAANESDECIARKRMKILCNKRKRQNNCSNCLQDEEWMDYGEWT